ncbi:sensor histidine kinase [Ruminococcus bicirculans (ex Wegman et al. 2014)]|jgi:two-component system sensor histidine kinase AgrC|uniref:sensor histidine kinase n=2 Tax=Ruminococcus TaxID=1263 RepID=UPI00242FF6DE|nr:ATP-binding protein [Ruminococcus bicirculans (ex Wegman et al. 2014)]
MKTAIIIACIALLISAFFLLRKLFYHLVDKRIARFQSDLISKQTVEIQNMYRQMQEWRHDYRNHIQNMKNRLDGDQGELEQYLDELADDLTQTDTSIQTGNVMADAVLNSKLSVAEQKSIQLNVKAHIPKGIEMTDVEMCSVLGNLLDNAIEACEKLPCDKRFLRVYIDKFKGQFYLSVQNSSPSIQRDKGIFRTTKAGTHGFGLFRIDRIAKKYGGYVNRQYEEGVFATELLLPLSG